MGVVYKARQVSLDRFVAVKMILGGMATKEFIQRFRVEASAAANLHHPNIVAVHEVGTWQGENFLVMDFVDGPNLARLVGQQPLVPRQAARYLKLIAEAVHYAHERNILHRDLKPANVLVDSNDQPRITDFGLAKRLEAETDLTLSGQVLGSPNYMSPEQAVAKRGTVGKRSDLYSLGAILYHLLTGRAPFHGQTITEVLHQVVNTEPVSPRLLNPGVPLDLETICLKCLEKEPEKRYPSAQALAEELNRYLNDETILARPVTRPERVWRWCRRKPLLASLSAATALLLLVVAIGSPIALVRISRERAHSAGEALQAKKNLYAADMLLAQMALAANNPARTRYSLNHYDHPRPGEPDLRDWEWRYLHRETLGDALASLPSHSNGVECVAFSPDGKTLASASLDGTTKLWDFATRTLKATLSSGWTFSVAYSPDGRTLATASGNPDINDITFWDAATQQKLHVITNKSRFSSVAFSPDGELLAGLDTEALTVWNAVTRSPIRSFPTPQIAPGFAGHAVVFSPDSRKLAFSKGDGSVLIWDRDTDQVSHVLQGHPQGGIWGLKYSHDGRLLASGRYYEAHINVWDTTQAREVATLTNHLAFISEMAFSLDDTILFSAGGDQKSKCGTPKRGRIWTHGKVTTTKSGR